MYQLMERCDERGKGVSEGVTGFKRCESIQRGCEKCYKKVCQLMVSVMGIGDM